MYLHQPIPPRKSSASTLKAMRTLSGYSSWSSSTLRCPLPDAATPVNNVRLDQLNPKRRGRKPVEVAKVGPQRPVVKFDPCHLHPTMHGPKVGAARTDSLLLVSLRVVDPLLSSNGLK